MWLAGQAVNCIGQLNIELDECESTMSLGVPYTSGMKRVNVVHIIHQVGSDHSLVALHVV